VRRSGWSAQAPRAAATPTTRRWTQRVWQKRGRQDGARVSVVQAEQANGMGPQGSCLDPSASRRHRCVRQRSVAYEFTSKGFARNRREHQRRRPKEPLRSTSAAPSQSAGRLRLPAEIYDRTTSDWHGRRSPHARSRLAAAQRGILRDRSARRGISRAKSSSTRGGAAIGVESGSSPLRPRKGCARPPSRGSRPREKARLAIAALAAQGSGQ